MVNLKLVTCDEKYWEFVRMLRTDPNNTNGFIQQIKITKEDQINYMTKYKNNYFVCLYNDTPVGYIGEIDGDIRVCTDHNYKNKGIGKFMVTELLKIKPNIFAKIKINNENSIKLFNTCGFEVKYLILEPK